MGDYRGPGQLRHGATTVDVETSLTSIDPAPGQRGDWSGQLRGDDRALFDMLGNTVELTLPSGQVGSLIITNMNAVPGGWAIVAGTGPPPF